MAGFLALSCWDFPTAGVLNSSLHSLFSDLKNAKTLLFFLAFKGNNMFARKTAKKQNKKTDYIQNGYLDVDCTA